MVEPVMYFGIGFLAAALLGLLLIPLVHHRAVRLTTRRLEEATPLSISEIRADKDQLRAEFAMSTRRLEMSVEQLKSRTTAQLTELGKKTDAINHLKKELGEKTATIFALEAQERNLKDQLRATEDEYAHKTEELREAERALAEKESELTRSLAELSERSLAADSQRIEIAAFHTQVEAMKASVVESERAVNATEQRMTRERAEAAAVAQELATARRKLDGLQSRTSDLEQQLLLHSTEAEVLGSRVLELERRLDEQGRTLVEREYQLDRLRGELESARRTETDLRAELGAASARGNTAVSKFLSDIAQLEAELAASTEERSRLQREVGTMRRDAESTWATERVENALLRERINDVAAEVARLTAALEGPGSPIEAMLAVEAPALRTVHAMHNLAAANGGPAQTEAAGGEAPPQSKSTLVDRIRALQSTASRIPN